MAFYFSKQAFDGEAASVLPTISVPSVPAHEKNTLTGMVPPQAYTRVNASTPPVPDAGSAAQKSMAPMGAQSLPKMAQALSREEFKMNMTSRPLVQDLVKQAMSNAAHRAKIAAEGARQMKLAGDDDKECCKDCGKDKEKCACGKMASASEVSTDYALKMAAAIEYATPLVVDMAKKAAANMPPAHITEHQTQAPEGVSASNQGGTPPGPGQQGKGHHQPPMNPGTQKGLYSEHGATQLENTLEHHVPGTQTTAMSAGQGKVASLSLKNIQVLSKIAGRSKKADIDPALAGGLGALGGLASTPVPIIGGNPIAAGLGAYHGAREAGNQGALKGALGASLGSNLGGLVGGLGGLAGGGLAGGALGALAGNAELGASAGAGLGALGGTLYGAVRGGKAGYRKAIEAHHKERAAQSKEAGVSPVDLMLFSIKQAEDAINPAQISAGPAVPPDTNASGEPGGAPVAGMPQGPRGLVGSNESAINYKKQTAYSPRKAELAQYFNEPALSSATDKTLNEAFAHTPEAGVKISAAQLTKSAAARALLAKLAGEDKKGH